MHIQQEKNRHGLTIDAYLQDDIIINGQSHNLPIVISRNKLLNVELPSRALELTSHLVEQLMEEKPEMIIIGSGDHQEFLPDHVLFPALKNRIGVECMTSAAASRTFTILASEGREVIAVIY
ncbi:Mth938-like domain-containing protein [Pleionea litopenaei]|uniref:MTH938/NDUFAF3 family protein n=1 Tax=Pleionea litopenaei TaxID=3070815 RepID=A0AA51RVZ1_9GAMM|nr:MTH938/NDUFAF3 family protein [Pleionea sp. HL-JVS1]WMS88607.1 MTH938/NDUFAF3 family protein [Pleionea sp. HL-JVS1]